MRTRSSLALAVAGIVAGLAATIGAAPSLHAMGADAATRVSCGLPTAGPDSTLLATFERGQTFGDFLQAAKARREGWLARTDSARIDAALLARARAVGGEWKLLVVAVDRCGDSMNSVPYLAQLADSVPGLSLRVVLPDQGRAVQDAHKSMDGRRATPTIVLLDASGTPRGCIVELPQEIRRWAHGVRGAVSSDSLHAGIAAFYRRDQGRGITGEAVALLEAAKAGGSVCERGS